MANAQETVIAVLPMQGPLRLALEEACTLAKVQLTPVSAETALASLSGSLIVAELGIGERRIPHRVLEIAGRLGGRPRLLLMCSEPLARPNTSLQGGRVIMMGPPIAAGRLASRMRMLLTDSRGALSGASLEGREWLTERWWIAAFRSRGVAPPSALLVQLGAGEGLIAVFPPAGTTASPELMRQLVEKLSREPGERERLQAIEKIAGDSGVVHLTREADRWLIHWPLADWHLSLTSALRLPAHSDLTAGPAQHGKHPWAMLAAPGDVLLACGSSITNEAQTGRSLREAKEDGGPATWDLLDARSKSSSAPQCGLLVEVR